MISHHVLTRIGFTEKEAKIYLACLEIGSASVLELSRKSGIPRGSVYDILEAMIEKAYVAKVSNKNGIRFNAADPEALLRKTQRSVRRLEIALPELKGLFNKNAKPQVRYFEGIEGIKRVYMDTLTASGEILNYSNSSTIRDIWPNYDQEYVNERIKKGIKLRGISPNDSYGKKVQKKDKGSLRELRLLSSQEFTFTNEINIYDNKVAITSFEESPIGILIESKAVADTQRDIFKMAWAFAGMKSGNDEKEATPTLLDL